MTRRGIVVLAGVMAAVCGGCVGSQTKSQQGIVWTKPQKRPLYRGIATGLSPAETWKEVCKRWSFGGKCAPFEPVQQVLYRRLLGKKRYPLDLRLFRYVEKDGPYPCEHYFAFRSWGLDTIRSYCALHSRKQLSALMLRFRKRFGTPKRRFRRRRARVLVWQDKAHVTRAMLFLLRGRTVIAVHKDLRLAWTRFVPALRPVLQGRKAYNWQLWQTIPMEVRREVLENFSRVTDRLSLYISENPLRALPSTNWEPGRNGMECEVRQPTASRWRKPVWNNLSFIPRGDTRLTYRWKVSPGSIYSRSFTLSARGCGFRFRLVIDQSGRRIQLQKLRFYRLKLVSK